ncbi:MAG: hypothetical protein HRU72_05620 [Planctomycetia bacterium]|nr:MAG: hypothetical protein HRU72_05620 [Planctomycetia bacterium]TVL94905.1 MAG: hypothetical protein CV082_13075 [Candidatus Brocadia sp. BL1]HQU32164.1 hypothetical protein [Candidatus Brocadia sapporoensis]
MDAYRILSYGTVGLGFLLALLAFRLLSGEQKQKSPRVAILRATYAFMAFSLILCVIGLASDLIKPTKSITQSITNPSAPRPIAMISDPAILREVKRASEEFLGYLDKMEVKAAYDITGDEFREFTDLARMKEYVELYRAPMGKLLTPRSINSVWSMEFPIGNKTVQGVSIEYVSSFEKKQIVRESVWLLPTGVGSYKVFAYNFF